MAKLATSTKDAGIPGLPVSSYGIPQRIDVDRFAPTPGQDIGCQSVAFGHPRPPPLQSVFGRCAFELLIVLKADEGRLGLAPRGQYNAFAPIGHAVHQLGNISLDRPNANMGVCHVYPL